MLESVATWRWRQLSLCSFIDGGGIAPGNGYTTVQSLNGTETDDQHGTETDDQHGTEIGDQHGTETVDQKHGTETMSGEVNSTASPNTISSEITASTPPSTDTIEATPTTPTPISTPDTPEDVNHTHLPSDPPSSDVINDHCDSEEPVSLDQEVPSPVDSSDSVDIGEGSAMEEGSPVVDYNGTVVDSSPVVDYSGTVVDDPELEEEMERSVPNGSYEYHLHSGVEGGQLGGHHDGGADEEHSTTPPLTAQSDLRKQRDNDVVGTEEEGDVKGHEPVADQKRPHDDQHSPEGTNRVPKTHQDHILEEDVTELLPTVGNSDGDDSDIGDDGDDGDDSDIGDDGDDGDDGDNKMPENDSTLEVQETGREVEEDGRVPADVVNDRVFPTNDRGYPTNDRGYPTNDRGYPTNKNTGLVMEGNSPDCEQQELKIGNLDNGGSLSDGGSHDSDGGSHDSDGRSHDSNGGSHDSDGGSHDSDEGSPDSDGGSHDPHSEGSDKDSENTSLNSDGMTNGSGAGMLTGQQKEKSVFLRLSNRIRDLEENMSLFSSYLDQISTGLKRNKNKTEDSQRSLERRLHSLNDSVQLLTNQTDLTLVALTELYHEVQDVSDTVHNISDQLFHIRREVWQHCLLVIALLSVIEVSVFLTLWWLCSRTKSRSHDNHVISSRSHVTDYNYRYDHEPLPLNGITKSSHIVSDSRLLGETSQQNLDSHSETSLQTWNKVERKRKRKTKTL